MISPTGAGVNMSTSAPSSPASSPSIKQELLSFTKRNTFKGLSYFVGDMFFVCLWTALALLLPYWWLQLVFAVAAGAAIAVLFVIAHDAGHDSLTPHRWLNRIVGRIALLPALHSFSMWVLVHNRKHHRWANLSPEDEVWTPLSLEEYRNSSWLKRALYRFYRSAWGPLLYYTIEFWIKRIIVPWPSQVKKYRLEYIFDALLVYAAAIGYGCFLYFGNQAGWFDMWGGEPRPMWNVFVFGFAIPFAVWNVFMAFSIYLMHTHPAIVWYNDRQKWKSVSQADTAVHVVFPGPVNGVFHWIMEHNVHHIHPSVPSYNLKDAQTTYEEREEEVVVFNWTIRSHLDVVRRCKLYDFEAEKWIDYQGEFTS